MEIPCSTYIFSRENVQEVYISLEEECFEKVYLVDKPPALSPDTVLIAIRLTEDELNWILSHARVVEKPVEDVHDKEAVMLVRKENLLIFRFPILLEH